LKIKLSLLDLLDVRIIVTAGIDPVFFELKGHSVQDRNGISQIRQEYIDEQ
jgi:hypothetical protein